MLHLSKYIDTAYLFKLKKIWYLVPYYDLGFICRLVIAWLCSIRPSKEKACRIYEQRKNNIIVEWLNRRYGYLIPKNFILTKEDKESEKIFVFWYQGLNDQTPDVVKLSVDSIKRNSNGREVILLTKDNICQWVEIPQYIYRLVDAKIITITHFSDILRLALLYKWGGYWIDATVFLVSPLKDDNFNEFFGSIKIPDYHDGTISAYRWTGFFLRAMKESPAVKASLDIILAYWKDGYKVMIDYFLIDYTFEMIYRKNKEFRRIVDSCPITNAHLYDLEAHLNETLNVDEYLKSVADTNIFKLNWKKPTVREKNGYLTILGQLLKKYRIA